MIMISLSEAEAARICYALAAEAAESSRNALAERNNGALSAASGRLELLHESARDEALAIVRKIEGALA